MADFQTEKIVKRTRKKHLCSLCNRTIPQGFSCHCLTGKSEGEFFKLYLCNTCWELWSQFPDSVCDWWEGYLSNNAFNDSCDEYEVSTPLQLLNKLNKEKNS